MANPWEFDTPVTDEDVKAQQFADATPQGDTWGHFMDVISNALGRGVATSVPYLLDIASLNRVTPHNPLPELTGRGKFTEGASRAYSKVAGEERPQSKAEERAASIAQGVGAAALPLGEIAGVPRALVAGAAGGAGAQVGHELFPNSEIAPLIGGLAGGFGPHLIESGVRSARTGMAINRGMRHPDWQAVNDVIVGDLEGGGTLSNPKVSPKGAVGPQQVIPETARKPGFGIRPWDGKTQADLARVGRQYSAAMMDKYNGDVAKVFAAYNAGPGRVDSLIKKHGESWFDYLPKETRHYVAKGMDKLGGGVTRLHDGKPYENYYRTTADLHDYNDALNTDVPDNVVEFPNEKLPELTEDELRDLAAREQPDFLTPAERQDMDASVPDYQTPPEAVDARSFGKGADYPEQVPANDTVVHDIADARQTKALKDFHSEFMGKVKDRIQLANELTQKAKDEGLFSFDVGDRFSTIHSRKNKLPPWKVIGHFVDPKDPEKYGYWVERGVEGQDGFERTQMPISDPNGDAKRAERGYPLNREAEVSGWQKQGIVRRLIEDEEGSLNLDGIFGRGERRKGYGESRAAGRDGQGFEGLDPEEKLLKALKQAQPVSAEQRRLYKQARAERSGYLDRLQQEQEGLTGFKKQAGALKGELPSANFNSIAEHFTTEDVNELLNRINRSNSLLPFEKFRAQGALMKLLGSEGAKVPTANEIKLLSGVLHENVIKVLLNNRTAMQKFWHSVGEAANFPRTIMASFDLSAPLRQGAFFIGRPQYWKAFASMFKQWGSEKAFQAVQQSIRDHPNFQLARKAGLSITDASGHFLSDREEAFMSHWAEKIPGVRMSDRAYSGFLNKLRFDIFNKMIEDGKKLGYNWDHETKALKQLGSYINAGSGRGSLGKFAQAAPVLNAGFFSPRYVASRFNLMNLPHYLIGADPLVRSAYIRDLATYAGAAGTVLALAHMSGAEVNTDWRSSDFLKIKIGNTRLDILSGFAQIAHLIGQLATNQYITAKGEKVDLGSKFGVKTRLDTIWNFIQSKFSPTVSWAADEMRGKDLAHPKDMVGQEHTALSEAANHLLPLYPQDVADALKDNGTTVDTSGVHVQDPEGLAKAVGMSVPGVFGVGVQTYQPRQSKAKGKKNPWEFDPSDLNKPSHSKNPWEF